MLLKIERKNQKLENIVKTSFLSYLEIDWFVPICGMSTRYINLPIASLGLQKNNFMKKIID